MYKVGKPTIKVGQLIGRRDRLNALLACACLLITSILLVSEAPSRATVQAASLTPGDTSELIYPTEGPGQVSLPEGFSLERVASGLTFPSSFAFLPDGRILFALKDGRVRVLKDGQLLSAAFIDLRGQVNTSGDRGMMSVAVDPNFDENHYVYLYFAYENDSAEPRGRKTARLLRVTAGGDTALPGSETVILGAEGDLPCGELPVGVDCIPADAVVHMGGQISFAPDGTLFLTTGDATLHTSANNTALRSQDINSLAGKVIRVSPSGQGLPDNPFWNGDPDHSASKVWAYGMRNAFRYTFRPGTNTPFIGDVGWSEYEEIDAGSRGGNYGWPCYEGRTFRPLHYIGNPVCVALYAQGVDAVIPPMYEWYHNHEGRCAIGGPFYTATNYPEEYRGAYFFGDCAVGYIKYMHVDAENQITSGPFDFAETEAGPVQIELGPDGNLYYLEIASGNLYRVVHGSPQPPPQGTTYLSDLDWIFMRNDNGPVERDASTNGAAGGDGQPITLNGVIYAKGLGAHALSEVKYYLGGHCSNFDASIGVDDEAGEEGSVVFQVKLDGLAVFTTGIMTGSTATQNINRHTFGGQELSLLVQDGGDGIGWDHADWADARITCVDVTPPTVTGVSPDDGANSVPLTASVAITFSEKMDALSITTSTLSLVDQVTGSPVSAQVIYSDALHWAMLQPLDALLPDRDYVVKVVGDAFGVRDYWGNYLADTKVTRLSTNRPPVPSITSPSDNSRFVVGGLITYEGTGVDPEEGSVPPERLTWDLILMHCPGSECHSHPYQTATGYSGNFVVPDHGDDNYFKLVLTAQDSRGQASSTRVSVYPELVDFGLHSDPQGLGLVYDGVMVTAPFTRSVAVGSTHNISAPSMQNGLSFSHWSDGGALQHDVQVGHNDVAYIARFELVVPGPTSTPTAICDLQFSDVPPTSAFYSFIRCLACTQVISGYGDGTFKPDVPVSRGQLAKVIANAAGLSGAVGGPSFVDVSPDDAFYAYIERLVALGAIGGYSDGTFRPANSATRGQIAKIIANVAGISDESSAQMFTDVPPTSEFYRFIQGLAGLSIIGGYEDGTFRPDHIATRGQVAKMAANAFSPGCGLP